MKREQYEHTLDLLQGATTNNLIDYYDNIGKYITQLENQFPPDYALDEMSFEYLKGLNKEIRGAKKYQRDFAWLLLDMYNRHCHKEEHPGQHEEDFSFKIYAKSIDELRQANVDVKFVVVKKNKEIL